MFVLTVDQVDSRHGEDLVGAIVDQPGAFGAHVVLGPDRTAGDEFQVVLDAPDAALDTVLALLRGRIWSVGLGVGVVGVPLPATTREATGPAFVSARTAVTAAKRTPHRFALAAEADPQAAAHLQALIDLLLDVRSRRSPEGWEAFDALSAGATQAAIADRLRITPQAVSLRLSAAGARLEQRAVPALVALLARLDADVGGSP